ncbi:MAG: M28 family peptidase, partial [Clostridia bacterium]|nr:M28 family peptidase [Clostridia bacterium]
MMDKDRLERLFYDTDYVRTSGTEAETKAAEYLKACCAELGVPARLEGFRVPMGEIERAVLTVDGKEIPCKGCSCCGSGEVEAELLYLPNMDKVSLANARGKIVLLDRGGVRKFEYADLLDAGVKGILFRCGNLNYPDRDIDQRHLREHVVDGKEKLLSVMIHASDAVELVRCNAKSARICVSQKEYDGQSHNVLAEIAGVKNEFITFSAHYDSTSLSHGAYDNMSGCAGLLGVMDALKDKQLRYGLRFVFCGSEERGLLGSKAYVRDNADELAKTVLNINLDMIGSVLGRFIA